MINTVTAQESRCTHQLSSKRGVIPLHSILSTSTTHSKPEMFIGRETNRSPLYLQLFLGDSDETIDLITDSTGLTNSEAAEKLRICREEQRSGGLNIQNTVSSHTELVMSTLVLAHFRRDVEFSFARLHPNTVNTLAILALEHIASAGAIEMHQLHTLSRVD